MRLLTHNSLISICKDSTKQVPLLLFIEDMEVEEREYDDEFMKNMLPSLCWDALKIAAKAIGMEDMPERYHPSLIQDEDFLRAIFNLLVNVHVVKGNMICQETGRIYYINDGIPDLVIPESEL